VRNMEGMFWGAVSFNESIRNWNMSSVMSTDNMYRDCPILAANKPFQE